MAKPQAADGNQWWPRIKDWLGIIIVLAVLALLGWIFFREATPAFADDAAASNNCGSPHVTISHIDPGESAEAV